MNANQLINMILRMIMRKAVNKGVNAGIDKMVGGGQQGRKARQTTKRARQAMRVTRRLNKF